MKLFQQGLPIYEYKGKIETTIKDNDFCIITGDTGSGKSTQLPQYMMDSEVLREHIISKQELVD
jgi:ATP-dependent RNA helicase DHX8/PRP22